jgi:hypothetical protein
MTFRSVVLLLALLAVGCGRSELDPRPEDAGRTLDGGTQDGGRPDSGTPDGGGPDGGCAGVWRPTGALPWTTGGTVAAPLPGGRVLVAGGGNSAQDTAVYDPDAGTFTPTGPMASYRSNFTATPLSDGRVLIAGGAGGDPIPPEELYNPATGQFTLTGPLPQQHVNAAAVRLADGRVLLAGGIGIGARPLSEAAIWSPATGRWTLTAPLPAPREKLTLTLLPDGTVLAAGGYDNAGGPSTGQSTAWRFDPALDRWTDTGSLLQARAYHSAVLLPSGQVLITGGSPGLGVSAPVAITELYDPRTGTFTETGRLRFGRYAHLTALLPSGEVLVAGGWDANGNGPAAEELYSPATGLWRPMARLREPRAYPASAVLPGGTVLAVGGIPIPARQGFLSSAEVFTPCPAP